MRKGRDGEKKTENKTMMKKVATTSLPAVDSPNADRWNTARSCPFYLCGIFLERKGEEGSLIFPPHNDEIVLNGLKHDKIILPPSCVSLEMGLTDEILVMGSHKVEELGKPSKEKLEIYWSITLIIFSDHIQPIMVYCTVTILNNVQV